MIFGGKEAQTPTLTGKLLAIIQETGFKVVLDKAQLVLPQVTYLGIVAGQEERQVDQRKVRALIKMPTPSDTHPSRALLGGFNFLSPHFYKYAEITHSLWKLLKNKDRVGTGKRAGLRFEPFKTEGSHGPNPAFPCESQPFVIRLAADKDNVALAATLLQNNKERNLLPIVYESKKLQVAEIHFDPCSRLGSRPLTRTAPITIQSTHTSLKYILSRRLMGGKVSDTRLAQWMLILVNRKGVQAGRGNASPD